MDYRTFERRARAAWEEIPTEYTTGVDGLVVRREAVAHPTLPEVFTLGHCLTEEHLSDYGSPDTTRSVIALYWGSFRELAALDEDFDWEGEIWDTLTHELRHHLESLAGDDALEDVDYASDQLFNRQDGRPFDPWYFQHGDDLGGGVYDVEGAFYIELPWRAPATGRVEGPGEAAIDFDSRTVEFVWHGVRYAAPLPAEVGDVHFLWPLDLPEGVSPVELVLVRRTGWMESLRGVLGRGGSRSVLESEIPVRRTGEGR